MYTFKRGDTFHLFGPLKINGAVVDITGVPLRCQVRALDPLNTLIASPTGTVLDGPTAEIDVYSDESLTAAWQTGWAILDVEATIDGDVTSAPPLKFLIVNGRTE